MLRVIVMPHRPRESGPSGVAACHGNDAKGGSSRAIMWASALAPPPPPPQTHTHDIVVSNSFSNSDRATLTLA
jgi:hypothetical protein